MYITILGRQPAIGTAELEHFYGPESTSWFSDQAALVNTDNFLFERLGGTQKAGRVVSELNGDWRTASQKIVQAYTHAWSDFDGKITLGISAYGFDISSRDVQKTGIILKNNLKKAGVNLRLIPNNDNALNTATSHHNKLGLSNNKVELLVVHNRGGKIIVAESIGAQNITAYTKRDQERPKRDAFVGMLPPKLAQIMINLATTSQSRSVTIAHEHLQPELDKALGPLLEPGAKPFVSDNDRKGEQKSIRLLDPFCGTGVILQEAALMGYAIYGTDIADKMVSYSRTNIEWLADTHKVDIDATIEFGDAMDTKWQQPIDAVICEGYLGQPFSAPPSPAKLDQVRKNCNHIMSSFLANIASQIEPGTPLCVAVPAWRDVRGEFTHLPFTSQLDKLGFSSYKFNNVKNNELLYYREDQVVARELLVLIRR